MIGIYKITSPTGRIYIGQSIDIERRFSQYRRIDSQVKSSVKLYRSLTKHGSDNHKFEVIDECCIDELNERERFYQVVYDATSDYNLNCILVNTKKRRRVCKPMSEKQKKQISAVHKGKKVSEETRAKIRAARAKQIITEEHKRKISENSGSARLVLNIENGVFHNSAKEASEAYNIKHNSLICRLIGKVKNKSNLIYV